MKDENAQHLLTSVMRWETPEQALGRLPVLQLLADYKYDEYQRFAPGRRFVESLASWLSQFDPDDREAALRFIEDRLVFVSEQEISHLVLLAYPDVVVSERLRIVSQETGIPRYRVAAILAHPRFRQLGLKSLYLGLSDGAHTNDLRRASNGEIHNEQIWQAYELGEAKAEDMLAELQASLADGGPPLTVTALDIVKAYEAEGAEAADKVLRNTQQSPRAANAKFTLVWLVDDFSGSGNTYIRFDAKSGKFKGKIKKIYERLREGDLIDPNHYEVFLLLYVATRQAIDHIEYWSERFTSENGFAPLKLKVLCPIEREQSIAEPKDAALIAMLSKPRYYDDQASDKHIAVGGTTDARMGFADCALPLVLSHNTPNNSIYALWGPDTYSFVGLFPRVSRHRDT